MTHWKPVDVIVATLTIVIGSVIVSSIFMSNTPSEYTELRIKLFQGLFTAIMSVISLYVGARLQANADKREP